MSHQEVTIGMHEGRADKVSGYTYLTITDARLLKLRSRARHVSLSKAITEIVDPAIGTLESLSADERHVHFGSYLQRVMERSEEGLNAFLDAEQPPFQVVDWVLPKQLIDRIDLLISRSRISRESLMSGILSDAINVRAGTASES
jgi:hypothetical protein